MQAVGESYMRAGVEDVVFCYMRFPSGLAAHLHLSWLDPHKERRFTVVGSRKMATFDDMELERKLTVYDKGFDEDFSSYGEYIARSGDIYSPRVPNDEPLRIECEHFVDCVRDGEHAALGRRRAGCAWCACSRSCSAPSTRAAVLRPSDRAPGLLLGEGVELPPTVEIGGHVVIHAGTQMGGEVRIQDGAVIGKPLALGAALDGATRRRSPPAQLGRAPRSAPARWWWPGRRIGDGAVIGDQAHVRERAVVGDGSVVGRGSAVDNDVTIGARVRIQTGCYMTAFSVIEDDVFVAPGRHADQRRHDGPPRPRPRAARRHAAAGLPGGRRRGARARGRGRRGGLRGRRRRGRGATCPPRAVVMGVPGARGARGGRRGPAGALRRESLAPGAARAALLADRRTLALAVVAAAATGASWRSRSGGCGAAARRRLLAEADDPLRRRSRGGGRDRRGGAHRLPRGARRARTRCSTCSPRSSPAS